jgi:hypothetical protein
VKNLVTFLAVLGRINPAIFDYIFPHGPVGPGGVIKQHGAAAYSARSRLDMVALNPQPLPPHELQIAAVEVANQIGTAAILAQSMNADVDKLVGEWIEDWCGTGRRPPWPRPWPYPWPDPDPDPNPDWDISASQVVGALALAGVAARLEEGPARDALGAGAERLMDAGLGV